MRNNSKHLLLFSIPLELILTISVLVLIPGFFARAGNSSPIPRTMTSTKVPVKTEEKNFGISAELSSSRNLVDFKDGSRSDNIELLFIFGVD